MTASTLFTNAIKYLVRALLPTLSLIAMLTAAPVWAVSYLATVPVYYPGKIAVNQVTNKVYVTSDNSSITVIDGATFSATSVAVGLYSAQTIAVNSVTNKIYVAGFRTVTVIDGATNSTTTIAADLPSAIAVNSVTNKIYVMSNSSVMVIDGATNSTATIGMGGYLTAIAVNPVTDKIYVGGLYTNVTVIDGVTNIATMIASGDANAIAVNPVTNKIYVAGSSGVVVIDGTTNSTSIAVAGYQANIAVNTITNKIYAVSPGVVSTVMVIDGVTNAATSVNVGWYRSHIAINPASNKIYLTASSFGQSITMIDGATNSVSEISPAGDIQVDIAVDPITSRIYVANANSHTVVVIGDPPTDTTPPVISTSQTPLPNANGWNNTDVTVNFTATDNVSIPTCTVNTVTLTADGAGQVVSTVCTDAAGNSATASLTVNIDKAPPLLTMPSLASNYTLGSSVALTFAAGDTLSGLASVSATLNGSPVSSGSTVTLNQLGTNTFTLTATDKAGNTATQTQLFTVIYGEEWQTDEPRHHDDESDGDGESHRKRDGRSHRDR